MSWVVRPAAVPDAHGIAEVHVLSWRVAYQGIVPESHLAALSVERRATMWTTWLSGTLAPGSAIWVAEDEGRVIGFANVGASRDEGCPPGTGELRAIYLLPSRWDRGVGRALHDRGMESLASAAFTSATLWVLEANARGRRFYERRGWGADGTVKPVTLGGQELPELRYRIAIPCTGTSGVPAG